MNTRRKCRSKRAIRRAKAREAYRPVREERTPVLTDARPPTREKQTPGEGYSVHREPHGCAYCTNKDTLVTREAMDNWDKGYYVYNFCECGRSWRYPIFTETAEETVEALER